MRHKAFALREAIALLAVVTITGALLFPYFARTRESEQPTPQQRCRSNLKQMVLAVLLYSQDNDERLPPAKNSRAGLESSTNWGGLVYSQLKAFYPFQCPLDKSKSNMPRSSYGYNQLMSQLPAHELRHITSSITFFEVDSSLTPFTQTGSNVKDVSAATRHDNGANYAFADGHVKWLKPQEITAEKPDGQNMTFSVK